MISSSPYNAALKKSAITHICAVTLITLAGFISFVGFLDLRGGASGQVTQLMIVTTFTLSLFCILMRVAEGVRVQSSQIVLSTLLAVHLLIPFLHEVNSPAVLRNWAIAHALLILVVLNADLGTTKNTTNVIFILSAFSIASITLGAAAFSVDDRAIIFAGRLTGILGHPNLTGMLGVISVCWGVYQRYISHRAIIIGAGAFIIVASLSLTSIFALGVALLPKFVTRPGLLKVLYAGAMFAYFIPVIIVTSSRAGLNLNLFTGRVGIWSWLISLEFPATYGLGLDFFNEIRTIQYAPWYHAHNQALMDYATSGLFALIAGTLIFAYLGIIAIRRGAVAMSIWLALTVHAITEIPLHLDFPGGRFMLFAVCVIAIYATPQLKDVPGVTSLGTTSSLQGRRG